MMIDKANQQDMAQAKQQQQPGTPQWISLPY
jgi:hypothetical protein